MYNDINNIHPCLCGQQPELKTRRECYGHGESHDEAQVVCPCGMSGKKFVDGYDGWDIKQNAIDWWNVFMEKHSLDCCK